MIAWWEAMNLIEQIFAIVGIASTVLLIIQVILLAVGVGDGGDGDVSVGHDVSVDMHDGSGDFSVDVHDGSATVHSGDWYGDVHTGDIPADGTFDAHTQLGGSSIHLFTLQGLVAFFAVFGWSGLIMLKAEVQPVGAVALAIVFGFIAMFSMAMIFRAMLKLQQTGNLDIKNALGKSGTVYLTIPAKREQQGKVSLMVQDRLVEMDAVTNEEEPIKTGTEVTVVGISNHNSLIVRKK